MIGYILGDSMKIPQTPPDLETLMTSIIENKGAEKLLQILSANIDSAPDGKYRHWDKLRHLTPPLGLTTEEWWVGIGTSRRILLKNLPLRGTSGAPFKYMRPEPMEGLLHEIDTRASGAIAGQTPEPSLPILCGHIAES